MILFVSSGLALPDVTGDTVSQAQQTLSNFQVKLVPQTSTTQTPGTVLSQSPTANTPLATGSVVTLTVAQAPTTIKVPDVVGDTPNGAINTLSSANLNVVQNSQTTNNPANVGNVIRQSPRAGANIKKNSPVTIWIGQAPATTTTTTTPPPTTTTTTTTAP